VHQGGDKIVEARMIVGLDVVHDQNGIPFSFKMSPGGTQPLGIQCVGFVVLIMRKRLSTKPTQLLLLSTHDLLALGKDHVSILEQPFHLSLGPWQCIFFLETGDDTQLAEQVQSSFDVMDPLSDVLQKLGSIRALGNLAHPALDDLHRSWQGFVSGSREFNKETLPFSFYLEFKTLIFKMF
jgi:hypothetical protein